MVPFAEIASTAGFSVSVMNRLFKRCMASLLGIISVNAN